MINNVDDYLFTELSFLTKSDPSIQDGSVILLEDCGEQYAELQGYCIGVAKQQVYALEAILVEKWPEHKSEITNAISSGGDKLVQCVNTYYFPNTITSIFLSRAGSIDNLLVYGPNGNLTTLPDNSSMDDNEEVTEEMRKEYEEKIKSLEEELSKKTKECEELQKKVITDEQEKELSYQSSHYEESDEETEQSFMSFLEQSEPSSVKEMLYGLIKYYCDTDHREFSRLITSFFHYLTKGSEE